MTSSKRGQKLAEVRAKLDAALELISPRARVTMLHQLLARAVSAMIVDEANRVVARTSSTRETPWPTPDHRTTWKAQVLKLVTDNPGISTLAVAKTLDMMRNTCASTLSGLGGDGLIQNLAGGWYPMAGKSSEAEPESADKDKGIE